MAQKLKNIDKWRQLEEGELATFSGGDPSTSRHVLLEVNAPFPARLYLHQNGGQVFLAKVDGLDTVDFYIIGEMQISSDAPVLLYSAEFEKVSVSIPDAESFTKIVERRHRNTELEYIAAKMQQNMERRLSQAAVDREHLMERLAALEGQNNGNNSRAPASSVHSAERQPDERSGSGAGDSGEAESGDAGTGDDAAVLS